MEEYIDQKISVWLNDRTGSLDRILGMIRRRRFSFSHFSADTTREEGILRVEIIVHGTAPVLEQIKKQVEKLADVQRITVETMVPVQTAAPLS